MSSVAHLIRLPVRASVGVLVATLIVPSHVARGPTSTPSTITRADRALIGTDVGPSTTAHSRSHPAAAVSRRASLWDMVSPRLASSVPTRRWRAGATESASYELPTAAATIATTVTATDTARLILLVTPAVLPVGLRSSSVSSAPAFAAIYTALGSAAPPSTIVTPSVDPDTIRGTVSIRLLDNGTPAVGRTVEVWTDARGTPGAYGLTLGHEHVAQDGAAPTIWLQGQTRPGEHVVTTTDENGTASFWIAPGYRGGPESVIAQAAVGGVVTTAVRSVIMRAGDFVDFAQDAGFDLTHPPVPSERFPFVLVGYSPRHHFAHFLDRRVAALVRNALVSVWRADSGRVTDGRPHYIAVNDGSLEYGGTFHLAEGDECALPVTGHAHAGHDAGTDLDISPCYTTGPAGTDRIDAATCEAGGPGVVRIDPRLLAAEVIGNLGGVLYIHRPAVDGLPFHYHLRVSLTP